MFCTIVAVKYYITDCSFQYYVYIEENVVSSTYDLIFLLPPCSMSFIGL